MSKVAVTLDVGMRHWKIENGDRTPVLRPELVERPRHRPNYIGSMYLNKLIQPKSLRERIRLAVRALTPWAEYFDAIAFSGMSGALIGPPVALRMGKEIIMVRKGATLPSGNISKRSTNAHSSHIIEGDCAARSYIILDDFMDSGKTREHITARIAERMPDADYLGLLQVNYLCSCTLDDFERRGTPYPLTQ
jgi:adenine/guanine phosphoribosyltransferase-like PRPP-binding protein